MVDSLKVYIHRYWKRGYVVWKWCLATGIRGCVGSDDGMVSRVLYQRFVKPFSPISLFQVVYLGRDDYVIYEIPSPAFLVLFIGFRNTLGDKGKHYD